MNLQGIVILLSFFLFLFTLYVLSREDFVFLRKNISTEEIFNIAFFTAIFTLFFSRLFFVFSNFDLSYLNPFVFFLIPYFPGLSLVGGIIGYVITVMIITRQKQYPRGRFIDFFSIAVLSVLPLGYAGFLLTGLRGSLVFSTLPIVYYSLLFLFYWKVLLPRFLQGQIKEGMLGLLFLMNFSLFTVLLSVIQSLTEKKSPLTLENGILVLLFMLSLFLYLRQRVRGSLRRVR